jgi:GntR family transcriptional regulator
MRVFESKRPLYQTVAEQLTAAIQDGTYPVGSMLPTEAELCQQFGVSRQTIREATRLLLQVGMISRHQGVGTRVERSAVAEHYEQRLGSLSDIWQYVKETRRSLLGIRDVAAADAGVPLPGDPQARWRVLEGLRFVGDETQPIAWTRVFVPPAYASVTEAPERDAVPIYSLIETHFGVKARSVRQQISAVAIPADIASHLRVPPGSLGLSMLRQYFSTEGECFEVSISIHPADRYQYTMQLDLAYAGAATPEAGEGQRRPG